METHLVVLYAFNGSMYLYSSKYLYRGVDYMLYKVMDFVFNYLALFLAQYLVVELGFIIFVDSLGSTNY